MTNIISSRYTNNEIVREGSLVYFHYKYDNSFIKNNI